MCFFGKEKHVAAIACLKKALYLDSFEWIIAYNLGLVYLNTRQYASAFHFLSASINLKPDFASSYMYLAIVLSRLNDFANACNAYEKAIDMEQDYMFHLVSCFYFSSFGTCRLLLFLTFSAQSAQNYAITLLRNDQVSRAEAEFRSFQKMFKILDSSAQGVDADVVKQSEILEKYFASTKQR